MQKKKLSKKGKIAAVGDRAPGSLLGRARGLAWPESEHANTMYCKQEQINR